MGKVSYMTVNGKIRSEHRSGEALARDYMHDPSGNVIGVYVNGWLNGDACYMPWGATLASWNMDSSYKFMWMGGWGYRQTNLEWSSTYVRARHYSHRDGAWTSRDPLWPSEMPYGYVNGRVPRSVDYWGLQALPVPMPVGPPLRIVPGGAGSSTGTGGGGSMIGPMPGGGGSQGVPTPVPTQGDPWGGTPHPDGFAMTGQGIKACFCGIWGTSEWLAQQAFRSKDYIEADCADLDNCKNIYGAYKLLFPDDPSQRSDPKPCSLYDSCVTLDLKLAKFGRRIEVKRACNNNNCDLIYGSNKPGAKSEYEKKLRNYVRQYKNCINIWKSKPCPDSAPRPTGGRPWGIPEPGSIGPVSGHVN